MRLTKTKSRDIGDEQLIKEWLLVKKPKLLPTKKARGATTDGSICAGPSCAHGGARAASKVNWIKEKKIKKAAKRKAKGKVAFVKRNGAKSPASTKQRNYLRGLGVEFSQTISRRDAGRLIDRAKRKLAPKMEFDQKVSAHLRSIQKEGT